MKTTDLQRLNSFGNVSFTRHRWPYHVLVSSALRLTAGALFLLLFKVVQTAETEELFRLVVSLNQWFIME